MNKVAQRILNVTTVWNQANTIVCDNQILMEVVDSHEELVIGK